VVSYQFVSRSIESWFDVKVEGALDAGLNLGRSTLDTLANDLANKTRGRRQPAGRDAGHLGRPGAGAHARPARRPTTWCCGGSSGQMIASAGQSRFQLNPERPTPQQLRARAHPARDTVIEGLDDPNLTMSQQRRIKALAVVPQPGLGLLAEPRYLQATHRDVADAGGQRHRGAGGLPRIPGAGAGARGLRRMYIGTLTLSLFLAVFGAVLLAIMLGNQLARPLLLLAAGVREVAAGDLSPKPALQGKDELGGLTRSFADMTQQLADARGAVEQEHGPGECGARQPADHPGQPHRRRDRAGCAGPHPDVQPGRHAHPAGAAGGTRGQPLAEVRAWRLRRRRAAALRRLPERAHAAGVDHWQQSFELNTAHRAWPRPTP
jgi:HAMP domain-containing protein